MIREKLAELYESEEQWSKAAQMLSGIDLDSGIRFLNLFFVFQWKLTCLILSVCLFLNKFISC